MELHAENRALKDVLATGEHGRGATGGAERLRPLLRELIERAQASGDLRPDFTPQDLPLVFWTGGRVIEASRGDDQRAVESRPVIPPEHIVLVEPPAHALQRRTRGTRGVAPAGTRELHPVLERLRRQQRRRVGITERFADRARLELFEVLGQRLHRALHVAQASEPLLGVLALSLQLGIAGERERRDHCEDGNGHHQLE